MSKRLTKAILLTVALLAGMTIHAWGQQQPSNVSTRTDVSVVAASTQLCPINGARVDCSCTNNDPATAVRIGDANVTATRGQRVPAGATFKATTTGSVFGFSEGGAVSMSCADQNR